MRTLVVYESEVASAHEVATALGEALVGSGEVAVLPLEAVPPGRVGGVDLLVVGGAQAGSAGRRIGAWLGALGPGTGRVAAVFTTGAAVFTTGAAGAPTARTDPGAADAADTDDARSPALTSGSTPAASTGGATSELLAARGFALLDEPAHFVLGADRRLPAGELRRARAWGATLAAGLRGAGEVTTLGLPD
jgi:hypothetical protein